MSTNLPPTGPPSGPPTGPPLGPPPSGPPSAPPPTGAAEVLEQGGGGPMPPGPPPTASSGGGRKWLIAGGVVGVLALGGAAFGAYTWLTSTGPQPAEALPADTLGYVSIDLDPSGSQKIAALKTLEKFPAADEWLDEEGIGSGDDIRKFIFGKIQEEEGACEGVDFEDDIQPWLGDRFAFAAVDGGEDEVPAPVGVVQVKDSGDAQDQVEQLIADCGGDPEDGGMAISGDWLILAETDEIAEQVADDAAKSNLADDEDFQKWTEAAGDPGILTAYASPEAGKVIAEQIGSFGSALGSGDVTDCSMVELAEGCLPAPDGDVTAPETMPDEMLKMFEDFEGLAVTARFDDGALELETAGDTSFMGLDSLATGDAGADVVSTLPADTAIAYGVGLEPGWVDDILEYAGEMTGSDDFDELLAEAEAELGLSLPEDAETLLGESAAIAVGGDVDPEVIFGSMSGISQAPIGAKIKGDTDAIQEVVDKLMAAGLGEAEILSSDSNDDYVVIGPNPDYLSELLDEGDLGDSDTFQDVVPEDNPSGVFFINFDAADALVVDLASGEGEIVENFKPLAGAGLTSWHEDGVPHMMLRVTTD